MGMSVYSVRLAKFIVKRGAANKLSICLGIARRADGGRTRGRTQKRSTLREITRVCGADDLLVTSGASDSLISGPAHHFCWTLERDLFPSCSQLRGMNSRLRVEFSSSSRNNSHPTNIARLCLWRGKRGRAFLLLPLCDSLPMGEINAVRACGTTGKKNATASLGKISKMRF